MGRQLEIVTPLHKATKRDYLARMTDNKVECMLKAKEYEFDYWDGNRRYGRRHNLTDPREIYGAGAEKLDDLLSWCADLTIPAITLWVFSTENFERRPEEVSGILSAIEASLASGKLRARVTGRK